LALTVSLLLFGKIIPRSTYEDMKEDRDNWRIVAGVSEERARTLTEQQEELIAGLARTNEVIQSLHQEITRRSLSRGQRQ